MLMAMGAIKVFTLHLMVVNVNIKHEPMSSKHAYKTLSSHLSPARSLAWLASPSNTHHREGLPWTDLQSHSSQLLLRLPPACWPLTFGFSRHSRHQPWTLTLLSPRVRGSAYNVRVGARKQPAGSHSQLEQCPASSLFYFPAPQRLSSFHFRPTAARKDTPALAPNAALSVALAYVLNQTRDMSALKCQRFGHSKVSVGSNTPRYSTRNKLYWASY